MSKTDFATCRHCAESIYRKLRGDFWVHSDTERRKCEQQFAEPAEKLPTQPVSNLQRICADLLDAEARFHKDSISNIGYARSLHTGIKSLSLELFRMVD